MIALLSTNFFRIRRDLLFWLALCVCLVGGIAFGMGFRGAPAFDDFYAFPFFVALCAFLSLFLGREYGDGTLRNKVTAGYRRGQIYLAYLLASLAVGLLFLAAFLLPFVVMNAAALAPLGAKVLGPALVGMVLLCAALVALFTAISCCVSLWVVGALVNLGLWFFLMFGAYQIEFALGSRPMLRNITRMPRGGNMKGKPPPTPITWAEPSGWWQRGWMPACPTDR